MFKLSLNEEFKKTCIPNYSNYLKVDENKIIIKDFFKYFTKARQFFMERDKWEVDNLDGNNKPGMESIYPKWFVQVLLEKYFIENEIVDDMNSYSAISMYFYNGMKPKKNFLTSTGIFPHIDVLPSKDNVLGYVCLVNLNNFPVTTQFWSYKNSLSCENEEQFLEYGNFITRKNKEYSNLSYQDRNNFLKNTPELKIEKEITYNSNECLIYPLNLYHGPKLKKTQTILNPRVLLRLVYDAKIK